MSFDLLSKLHITLKWIQRRGRNVYCVQSVINSESCAPSCSFWEFHSTVNTCKQELAAALFLLLLEHCSVIFLEAGLRLVTSVVFIVVVFLSSPSSSSCLCDWQRDSFSNVKLGEKITDWGSCAHSPCMFVPYRSLKYVVSTEVSK